MEALMKRTLAALALTVFAGHAFAFVEKDAAKLVQTYSKSVACQIEGNFKPVKVSGASGPAEQGDRYVVYWDGDIGCLGGNGTVTPNFSVVEMGAFGTPVVLPNFKIPEIFLSRATKFSGKDGKIYIQGVTYGPNDQQGNPTKRVSFTLKVEDTQFVKQ
jgi:hypothetical protein